MAAAVFQHEGFPEVRPFLKWVGGKTQLLPHLMGAISELNTFNHYHEPFVGGGALYFSMWRAGLITSGATLADINDKLIGVYEQVRDNVETVIRLLPLHAKKHDESHYYKVRSEIPRSASARAARLIYLNKTCFNGLFRENSRGEFNVPMGRYANPCICDAVNLRACSAALADVTLQATHFEDLLTFAHPGDLVYFDPPYHPLTKTASFTTYSKNGFSEDSQRRLAEVFAELASRRVHVLLSNSDTPLIRGLFQAFRLTPVLAKRCVNSRGDLRGDVSELLVSSF
jgi:DNA adenine methylase